MNIYKLHILKQLTKNISKLSKTRNLFIKNQLLFISFQYFTFIFNAFFILFFLNEVLSRTIVCKVNT